MRKTLVALLIIGVFLVTAPITLSDELEDQLQETNRKLQEALDSKQHTQSEIDRLYSLKLQYQNTLNNLRTTYSSTEYQLGATEDSINAKSAEITETDAQITQIEAALDHRQKNIRQNIRSYYINNHSNILSGIFVGGNATQTNQTIIYQGALMNDLHNQIVQLNSQISEVNEIKKILAEIKTQLEIERDSLVARQYQLQNQITVTQSQYETTHNQQINSQQVLIGLDEQIGDLTQKQKSILAAKAAAALKSTSVGDSEINPASIEKNPPQDGQVYFSFWTYGYPHRVGMSQYGAFGRSIAGQNADQILTAYYAGVEISDWTMPEKIKLTNGQEIDFENDYLLGIGEMPSCWGKPDRGGLEALKAQAIAARTYALSYTKNGANPICTDQNCQVYVGSSKVNGICGEYWKQAVEETRGRVILSNGEPITAWYASTSGGFTLSSAEVWGGAKPYVLGIKDYHDNSPYEGPGFGDSPWYHKSWGAEPWLTFAQVSDIFNAALLPESYNSRIDSLSSNEIAELQSHENIDSVINLQSLEVIDENGNPGAGTAQTAFIRAYYEDGKMAEATGKRFKYVYNLRSPSTNAIWTTRFDILTAAEL